MKENMMKTSRTVLTLALAALLFTPPAHAAKHKKMVKAKANPEATRLMSAGLANLENGETSAAISAFNNAPMTFSTPCWRLMPTDTISS